MTQFLEKYTSHFIWKGCVWEGVGDRTELQHIDPHSISYNRVSLPFSWAAQLGAWGPSLSGTCSSIQHLLTNWSDLQTAQSGAWGLPLLGAGFLYHFFLQLVWSPKLTDFLSSPSYIIVQLPPSSCGHHNFALIQPVHSQSYTLLFLDRMHLLFTLVHFLFWQLSWVIGQYTTCLLYLHNTASHVVRATIQHIA